MALVRVQRLASLDQAVRAAAGLPDPLVDAVYLRLQEYLDQELDGARYHTQWLAVSGRHVRATFFVDTDGTLNVDSLEASA